MKQVTFRVEPAPPLLTRVLDWMAQHVLAVAAAALGLLAFLLLIAVCLLLRRRRRRRAAVEAPPTLDPNLAEIKRELAELREQARARDLMIAEERIDVRSDIHNVRELEPVTPVPQPVPSLLDGLMLARRAVGASIHRRRAARTRR